MPKVKHQPHKKPHYKGLTRKQAIFTDEIVRQTVEEGKINSKQAGALAFPEAKVPRQIGYETLTKPYVREAYLIELERQGVTDELASGTVKNALLADKRVRDYETGEIRHEPDHPTRLKAAQEYHKVKGLYPDKRIQVDKRVANINIYAKMDAKRLKKEVKRVTERISELQEE